MVFKRIERASNKDNRRGVGVKGESVVMEYGWAAQQQTVKYNYFLQKIFDSSSFPISSSMNQTYTAEGYERWMGGAE
jgi:hypothetical protein